MNHSEEHYQRREKFLKDKVTDQIKLERGEWIMSKKEALASFLGRDKLAELNAQRMPDHWPMKDGPEPVPLYINLPPNIKSGTYLVEVCDPVINETPWELEEENG